MILGDLQPLQDERTCFNIRVSMDIKSRGDKEEKKMLGAGKCFYICTLLTSQFDKTILRVSSM